MMKKMLFTMVMLFLLLAMTASCGEDAVAPNLSKKEPITQMSGDTPKTVNAQIGAVNLVQNGDFELRKVGTNCPIGPWNMPGSTQGFPSYWDYGVKTTILDGSGNYIFSTPDYLQTCADIESGYHPSNHLYGSQTPRSGNSMGGIISSRPDNHGEYFIQELDQPLNRGETYNVEFFVSLADKTEYVTNGLGVYFTNNFQELILNDFPTSYEHFTPQVPNTFPGPYYSDDSNWTKISGTYTPPVPGIKYLVIGDFSQSVILNPNPGKKVRNYGAYYYIDDVSIKSTGIGACIPSIPSIKVMDPNWGSNGETCTNYTLELSADSNECPDFIRYEWVIQGATVQNTYSDGRYIFVKTSASVGTNLTFKVRGVYTNGYTNWAYTYGTTVAGFCGE